MKPPYSHVTVETYSQLSEYPHFVPSGAPIRPYGPTELGAAIGN